MLSRCAGHAGGRTKANLFHEGKTTLNRTFRRETAVRCDPTPPARLEFPRINVCRPSAWQRAAQGNLSETRSAGQMRTGR